MATWLPERIAVTRVDVHAVAPLRARLREDVRCQIVHDSILPRGLADPYVVTADGQPVAYGAVWNRYHPGRVVEFEVDPQYRAARPILFSALLQGTGAREMEAPSAPGVRI